MNIIKTVAIIGLTAAATVGLTGCGNTDTTTNASTSTNVQQQAPKLNAQTGAS